ncbi:MAG: PD-(D/E)XK motif protein, partial [Burkholderiaceae bacterium]|nr:PD-(D/E)XK motif protein [Burkholderiaceae bacterium]
MHSEIIGYEQLRGELETLSNPSDANDRKTLWVVDRVFGIAKTLHGAIELFLVGDKLTPASSLVRRHLEYGRWQIAEEHQFIDANRIVLPAEPHFLPLAATIGVELVRVGLNTTIDLLTAFRKVEPLIELALRRSALAEEHILGLIGELLCLEVMLDALSNNHERRETILDMWRGHTKGLRDFVIGGVAIEVKTTQLQTSSHKFSGLHQV